MIPLHFYLFPLISALPYANLLMSFGQPLLITSHCLSLFTWIPTAIITIIFKTSADSIEDLEDKISSKSTLAKTARQSLIDTEHQLKELGEILKYAKDYQTNKVYNFRYKKSKDPDAYFRRHETELTLFDGAENMLKRFGINPKNLDLEQLQADYNALQAKKTELQKTYKSAEKEVADLNRKLANIKQYLGQEQTPERTENKKTEQSL